MQESSPKPKEKAATKSPDAADRQGMQAAGAECVAGGSGDGGECTAAADTEPEVSRDEL